MYLYTHCICNLRDNFIGEPAISQVDVTDGNARAAELLQFCGHTGRQYTFLAFTTVVGQVQRSKMLLTTSDQNL